MTMEERRERDLLLGNIKMAQAIIERSERRLKEIENKAKDREDMDKKRLARVFGIKTGINVNENGELNMENVFGEPLSESEEKQLEKTTAELYGEGAVA